MAARAGPAGDIVRLKVTLRGIRPPIWRRLLVPKTMRLDRLHFVLQIAMGWRGGHLHAFTIDGREYGDPAMLDHVENEKQLTLGGIPRAGVKRFTYTYDFGDDWEHVIAIEKTEPPAAGQHYPVCVAGKRGGPPEDCGGVHGYMEMLEVLADPAHPEYKEYVERLEDESFDAEDFPLDAINQTLAAFGARQG